MIRLGICVLPNNYLQSLPSPQYRSVIMRRRFRSQNHVTSCPGFFVENKRRGESNNTLQRVNTATGNSCGLKQKHREYRSLLERFLEIRDPHQQTSILCGSVHGSPFPGSPPDVARGWSFSVSLCSSFFPALLPPIPPHDASTVPASQPGSLVCLDTTRP